MLTLFEAAANMAERKRERERREALDKYTKNILEKIMNERRAKQEAVQEKAEWKRERERKEALGEHTLEKIMEKIMNERRAKQEAAQEKMEAWEKAEAWDREITYALDKTGDLCTLLGAMVEAVRFENGIIWIRRPGEAIQLQVGEIRDAADLRAACKKMLGSVCKC